jgi:hypothetical protein
VQSLRSVPVPVLMRPVVEAILMEKVRSVVAGCRREATASPYGED